MSIKNIKVFQVIVLLAALAIPHISYAQANDDCGFGRLEVSFPGINDDICALVRGGSPLLTYAGAIINFMTGLVVVIGVIAIVIGGYMYMTAGGSSDQVGRAKTIINSAILGIILALTAYLIMNTISPQFGDELREPPQPGVLN